MKKFTGIITGVLVVGLILVGPGCRMVKPPEDPAAEWTPPDWAREEQETDPVQDSLRKRVVEPDQPLSLARCVEISLANNPSTRQAWASARAAAALIGQAESQLYPQLTVSGKGAYLKQKYSFKGASPPIGNSPDTDQFNYGPGLDLTYLLFDFGGVRAGVEEARQTLLAANFSFNQAIQDLMLNVEKAYYGFYSSQAALDAARADVKDTSRAMEAAHQKFQVGLVSKLDDLQARSSYEDSLYKLEAAKGDVKSAKAVLAETLGLPADAKIEITKPTRKLPTEISDEDVSKLIEKGLKNRPDISAQRSTLRAKEASVGVVESALWPELNLGGSADKNWYSYRTDPELYNDSYMYTGYLSLQWDIFTGFYDLNRKREAREEVEKARESLVEAELGASADVWTKYYAFNTAVGKYKFSLAFLSTSQESYNLALESYNTGLKSILDLLQSQSSLSSARSQLIGAEKDLFTALAALAHATGSLGVREAEGAEQ